MASKTHRDNPMENDAAGEPARKRTKTSRVCERCGVAGVGKETMHDGCKPDSVDLGPGNAIRREKGGKFRCPKCQTSEYAVYSIKLHWDKCPQKLAVTTGAVGSNILRRYSLRVNTTHNILICVPCGVIIDPSKVSNHFGRYHPQINLPPSFRMDLDVEVFSKHKNLTFEPTQPTLPIDAIDGLTIRKNYLRCETCGHCYNGMPSFNKHVCSGIRRAEPGMWPVQQFTLQKSSPFFAVIVPEPVAEEPLSMWDQFRMQEEKLPLEEGGIPMDDNYRVQHQFLIKEGWLERVKGHSHQSLMPIVPNINKNVTYQRLLTVLTGLLVKTQQFTTAAFLKRMIGTRPTSEHTTTFYLGHSRVNDATCRTYARRMVHVVSMIASYLERPHKDYKIRISTKIEDCVLKVVGKLGTDEDIAPDTTLEQPIGEIELNGGGGEAEEEEGGGEEEGEGQRETEDEDDGKEKLEFTEVEKLVLDLLWSLFTDLPKTSKDGPFFSPVFHYLLLSSLQKDQQWTATTIVTQKLAALQFVGRLTFAAFIIQRGQEDKCTHHEAFKECKVYLEEEKEGLMPSMYLLMRGLAAIRSAENNQILYNAVDCSGRSAIIGDKTVSLDGIGTAIRWLIKEIDDRLDKLLFERDEFCLDPSDTIHDEPKCLDGRYCFLDDNRNSWRKPGTRSVLQYILDDPTQRNMYAYRESGQVCLNVDRISKYAQDIHELQKLLFLAVYLSFGEPARGTEMASNLLRNKPGGSIRTFFVLFGVVVLRGSFSKTSFFTSTDKCIVRIPSEKIGRQLLRFFVFLRPLFTEFQRYLRPDMFENSILYLWPGLHSPISAQDLSGYLQEFTLQHLEVPMSIRSYRQFMSFMTKSNYHIFNVHPNVQVATDDQLGHTTKTDREFYGQDSRLASKMSISEFHTSCLISGTFHYLFGLEETLLDRVAQWQAPQNSTYTHIRNKFQVASETHSRLLSPSNIGGQPYQDKAQLESARVVAQELSSYILPPITQALKLSNAQSQASVIQLCRSEQSVSLRPSQLFDNPPHPNLLHCLRTFFKDKSGLLGFYNPTQARVTQLLVEGTSSVLHVSPTGSGKTLPGLLASKYFDGNKSTIWVVPLNSMHEQYQTRCSVYEFSCESWTETTSAQNPPTHIIITIDKTAREDFIAWLNVLVSKNRLARIIIDEAHLVLAHKSFRPIMSQVSWVGATAIPTILLTATLPPAAEETLFKAVGIECPIICRLPTFRANISYSVVQVLEGDIEDQVEKEVKRRVVAGDRYLVFVQTKEEARKYGERLDIPWCNSNCPMDDINTILADFRKLAVQGIATTSILGVALDVPGVTYVFHVGTPRNIVDFVQETGRIGRDEGTVKGFSVVVAAPAGPTKRQADGDWAGAQEMEHWVWTKDCRRGPLGVICDGEGITCSMIGGKVHLCDNCENASLQYERQPIVYPTRQTVEPSPLKVPNQLLSARAGPPNLPKNRPISRFTPVSMQVTARLATANQPSGSCSEVYEFIYNFLVTYETRCIFCHLIGIESNHLARLCRSVDLAAFKEWREKLVFAKGSCFSCGLPQSAQFNKEHRMQYIHSFSETGANHCPWKDVPLLAVWATLKEEKLCESVTQTLRNGKLPDDKMFPMTKWIVMEQGLDMRPNLVNLLLFLIKRNGK